MPGQTVDQALAATATPLTRKVLKYVSTFKAVIDGSRASGLSLTSWDPLAGLIAVDAFERVGVAKEVMNWPQYADFLTRYAGAAQWDGAVRRITEVPDLVILELEERNTVGGKLDVSNTVTIYEFDSAGKIKHLDVYLQREMPLAVG